MKRTPKQTMNREEILQALEACQMIQMRNPPSSEKWQEASENIAILVKMLSNTPEVIA